MDMYPLITTRNSNANHAAYAALSCAFAERPNHPDAPTWLDMMDALNTEMRDQRAAVKAARQALEEVAESGVAERPNHPDASPTDPTFGELWPNLAQPDPNPWDSAYNPSTMDTGDPRSDHDESGAMTPFGRRTGAPKLPRKSWEEGCP